MRMFLCLALFSTLFLSELCDADSPSDQLIEAIEAVESGGDVFAVGDKHLSGKAYGCLQIRQPCVDDYNKWNGTSYRAEDMLGNCALSREIFKACIDHYAIERRIGRKPTFEDMARIWNGGPNGFKKSSTEKYWKKVKVELTKGQGE